MSESGMIGDKEVTLSRLDTYRWTIDVVKHTSDDTKELVEGWEVEDEQKALALYDEKVKKLGAIACINNILMSDEIGVDDLFADAMTVKEYLVGRD